MNENTEITMAQILAERDAKEKEYIERIKYLEARIERLNGVIEGLKFATRCNGVSGGDVF